MVAKVSAETLYQTELSLKRSSDFKTAIEQFEQTAANPSYHLSRSAKSVCVIKRSSNRIMLF